MEYTIGSLADLISGKNTPNKPKVVKVKVKQENNFEDQHSEKTRANGKKKRTSVSLSEQQLDSSGNSVQTNFKKKKRKNSNNQDDISAIKVEVESNNQSTNDRKKKRKSSDLQEQELVSFSDSVKINSKKKKRKISNNEDDHLPEKITVEQNASYDEDKNGDVLIKKKKIKKEKKDKSTKERNSKKDKKLSHLNESNLADSDQEVKVDEEETGNDLDEKATAKKGIKAVHDPEEQKRTIFVGNVPLNIKKKKMRQFFNKYGTIEALWFRGIPVANPKIPKRVAAITKEFHPDRSSLYCYIRFANQEEAEKALEENGSVFQEHHLRVHRCDNKEKPDESKAIFIGNLAFNAEEEGLWKLFEPCGKISSVRIIRDSYTGMGKGFAYVNFEDADAVQLALEMENVKLNDRELRIKLSSVNTAKKNKKKENKKNATRRKMGKERKNGQGPNNEDDRLPKNKKPLTFKTKGFQGSKVNKDKKKFKVNKGALEKKQKIKKIAPH